MKLYSTSQLAAYFGVGTGYILHMRRRGIIPYYKLPNNHYRFDLEEVKKVFRGAK